MSDITTPPVSRAKEARSAPEIESDSSRRHIVGLMQSYSGPIMPPQLLKELEEIIPGGAERVLSLSEKEQAHRHKTVEGRTLAEIWQVKASLVGGVFAFAVLVAGIVYCAANGYTSGVVALGGAVAFGVVSHIIRLPKREGRRKEPEENLKAE